MDNNVIDNNVVYVLSGNFREFVQTFGRMTRYRYIASANTLKGIRGGRYVKIGTWHTRYDLNNILLQLEISEMIDFSDRLRTYLDILRLPTM